MNATNIQARRLNTSNLIYANAFYGEFADVNNPFTFYDFFPSLYNLAILNKIFSSIGWNIDGDLLTDSLFTKSVLPFSNHQIGTDDIVPLFDGVLDLPSSVSGVSDTIYLGFDSATLNILNSIVVPSSSTTIAGSAPQITIHDDALYYLQVAINYVLVAGSFGATSLTLVSTSGGQDVVLVKDLASPTGFNGGFDNLFIKAGTYIVKWDIDVLFGTINTITGSMYLECQANENFSYKRNVPENYSVEVSKSLPDITQSEFIKTIVNQFNVIIESDYITKTVSFNKFESIKNNKSIALDWTEKVDLSETAEINFTPENYGQANYFNYEQDENDSYQTNLTIGDGSFAISNTQLDLEKDLVKLPFAASVRNFIDSVELMVLPIRLDSIKPRIAYIEITSNNIVTMVGQSTPTQSAELFFDELKFSNLLTNYYPYLISMLQRYRLVKILFNLKSIDLINIDYRKPIFVDFNCEVNGQVRGYFYLNLVDQFNGNSTTMCELIKLN